MVDLARPGPQRTSAGRLYRSFFQLFLELVEIGGGGNAAFDTASQGHLLFCRQKPDLADLLQVRPYRVGATSTGDSDVKFEPGNQYAPASAKRVVCLLPKQGVIVVVRRNLDGQLVEGTNIGGMGGCGTNIGGMGVCGIGGCGIGACGTNIGGMGGCGIGGCRMGVWGTNIGGMGVGGMGVCGR